MHTGASGSNLCEQCSAIFGGVATGTADDDDIEFYHHRTLTDFRQAVAQGCPLCRRFYDLLSKEVGKNLDEVENLVSPSKYATTITISPYSRSLDIQVDLNLLRSPSLYAGGAFHLYPWDSKPDSFPRARQKLEF
jgi:hypothetical protein